MKKSVSIILSVILTCSACLPLFAQQAKVNRISPPRGFIAEYETIKAYNDGQPGVFIRWDMRSELNNIGFFVYRMGDNGLELLNSSNIILGSSGTSGQRVLEGASYEYYDANGTLGSTYMIRNQFTNGSQVDTDPFNPRFTANFPADTGHTKAELSNGNRSRTGNLKRDSLVLPPDLQAVVDQSVQTPNPETQQYVTTQQGVKIAVKKEGMYRVTRAELQAAGFDVNSDPTNWRMFMNGNEQAIIVEPAGQYIEFYGKGLDIRETDTRTYYLISDGVAGRRMITKISNNIGGNVISKNYQLSVEAKDRLTYIPGIKNGDAENYFGRLVYSALPTCPSLNPSDPPCVYVNLSGIDYSVPYSTVSLKVQGYTITQPNHTIRGYLNGHDVGFLYGDYDNSISGEFSFPTNFLNEGQNLLQMKTVRSSDTVLCDSIKVTYARKYQADQNKILFFTPGYRKMNVTGFTSPNVRVFETTLDGNPQLIANLPITQDGGTYTVTMPSNRPGVMFAVEDSALMQVSSITHDNPSTLATANNSADMLIISYSAPDFMAAAETWANYRRSAAGGNFNVKVVDIDDVYDEFSYGVHTAMAITNFLQYATNSWQTPKPHYVLLIGDASIDARNYTGQGYNDLIPTRNVELIYEVAGSDEALADFNHDGLAEMAVGRIPARSASVINTIFNKTIGFETQLGQSLDRGALFAFDRPDGFDFEAMSHILADELPPTVPITYVNRMLANNPTQIDPNARQNLFNALNSGQYVVNYSGHGSSGTWASVSFFSSVDAPLLTNLNRQSIMTMLTCFNGNFNLDKIDSLGEAVLKASNGGAVASWASATETTPNFQLPMGMRFYHNIGFGNMTRIGDSILDSKIVIAGSDVGYSWVLLGDPALKIR